MNTLPLYLTKETSLAMTWTSAGEHGFDVKVYRYGMHTETLNVTDLDLAQHHKALAPAIRALIDFNANSTDEACAAGHKVIATLAVLEGRYYELKDMQGDPRLLLDITHLDSPGNDRLYVSGTCVELDYFMHAGVACPYALSIFPVTFTATSEELETLFPGWLTRYYWGTELALSWSELVHYAFSAPHQPVPVVIPQDMQQKP